jgi:TIR domain-containing protein
MADIFLSYAEEDREVARKIGKRLESIGWSVWWDREIPAGKDWRTMLEAALANMRCMVVLWSKSSIKSDWVKEEAEEGRTQGKLVPILIESVRPPVGFRAIQAADLIDWDGSKNFPGFIQLTSALQSILGDPEIVTSTMLTRTRDGHENDHQQQNNEGRSQHHTKILNWANQLPWWSYAVATVLITLLIATYMRRHDTVPGTPSSATLPVKSLDAGELDNTPADSPRSSSANPGTTNEPASASRPTSQVPSSAKKASKNVENATRARSPITAQDQTYNARCTDILTRAQLGEPVSDSDREFLRRECPR